MTAAPYPFLFLIPIGIADPYREIDEYVVIHPYRHRDKQADSMRTYQHNAEWRIEEAELLW